MSSLLPNVLLFQAGWFACVLGAADGYAGARMGALQLLQPAAMLAALAAGWALATPLLLALARRLATP